PTPRPASPTSPRVPPTSNSKSTRSKPRRPTSTTSPSRYDVEDLLRGELYAIDRLSHAVDVCTAWAHGRSVTLADLTDSAEILADVARQAPLLAVEERQSGEQLVELSFAGGAVQAKDIGLARCDGSLPHPEKMSFVHQLGCDGRLGVLAVLDLRLRSSVRNVGLEFD